ncbi:MAG: hypothetical protein V3U75_02640 [Methylococcaceae bacterium]
MDIQRTVNRFAPAETRITSDKTVKPRSSDSFRITEEKQESRPATQVKQKQTIALQQKLEEKHHGSGAKYASLEESDLTQSAQQALSAYQNQLKQPQQAELQQISETMGIDLFV